MATPEGIRAKKKVEKAYEVAVRCKNEYQRYEEQNATEKEYLSEGSRIKNELEIKYTKKFYECIRQYVSEEERKKIDEMLQSTEKIEYSWQIDLKINKNEIYSERDGIVAFSKENEEKLNLNNFEADSIKRMRIRYFKSKGIDLGDDYYKYKESELAQATIPPQDTIEAILLEKRKCNEERKKEFFFLTSNYLDIRKQLKDLNLCAELAFPMSYAQNGVCYIIPNVIKGDNGYTMFNVIYMPILNMSEDSRDVFIIHEIMHGIGLNIQETENGVFNVKTGFDQFDMKIIDEKTRDEDIFEEFDDNSEERETEDLNENINHRIAINITDRLHEKGIYLLDNPLNSKTNGTSQYEHKNCITNKLYKDFFASIIEGIMAPDMNTIFEKVGKDNFQSLNEVVVRFGRLPFYQMVGDLMSNRDTELTRTRTALIEQAEQIVENMKVYQQSNPSDIKLITMEDMSDLTNKLLKDKTSVLKMEEISQHISQQVRSIQQSYQKVTVQ